jgi:hypothetical protein
VVIEIVSDKSGGEDTFKRSLYARIAVPFYAIFDPDHYLSKETLRTCQLSGGKYRPTDNGPWEGVGLGLRLWKGKFEGVKETWLRWCNADGVIIPTGEERAEALAKEVRKKDEKLRKKDERIRLLEAELRSRNGKPSSK